MSRRELFQPTIESEARLLILINSFSGGNRILEGRTKLAKLDFFLRYPRFLREGLRIRARSKHISQEDLSSLETEVGEDNIENRMVRYKYGPWDPLYYTLLGKLIGRGFIEPLSFGRGIGFKTTDKGKQITYELSQVDEWGDIASKCALLRKHFNLTGTNLKQFIYENFPEVTQAEWGEEI